MHASLKRFIFTRQLCDVAMQLLELFIALAKALREREHLKFGGVSGRGWEQNLACVHLLSCAISWRVCLAQGIAWGSARCCG